jgi:hypothetical protein
MGVGPQGLKAMRQLGKRLAEKRREREAGEMSERSRRARLN